VWAQWNRGADPYEVGLRGHTIAVVQDGRGEGTHRFDLDGERSINDQVDPCGSDAGSFKHDAHVPLAFETNRSMPKRNVLPQ
jgi:hypothetical protein